MRGLKYQRIFDAHSNEIGNGKKAAIVDALIQVLPERQLVILLGEQMLQQSETGGIAFPAIDFGDIFCNERGDLRAAADNPTQPVACVFKTQTALGGAFCGAAVSPRKFERRSQNPRVLVVSGAVLSESLFQSLDAMVQNLVIRARRNRKKRLKVPKEKAAFVINQLDLAGVESFPERAPENRKQNLALEGAGMRVPVDIEENCES